MPASEFLEPWRVSRYRLDQELGVPVQCCPKYISVLELDQPLGAETVAGSAQALADRLDQIHVALRLKPAALRPEVLTQKGDVRRLVTQAPVCASPGP